MRLILTLPTGQIINVEDVMTATACRALYQAAITSFGIVIDDIWQEPDLETVRGWALAHIADLRGKVRAKYIPNVAGQENVYQDKLQQARDFSIDPAPTVAKYPTLYGEEAAARGLTPAQMATLIASKAKDWRIASDKIEAAAYKATNAVMIATMVSDIVDILVLLRTIID